MRTAYHVTEGSLFSGDEIRPGRHADRYRAYKPHVPISGDQLGAIMWEIALESARLAATPNKPSRLDSVFGWETLSDARAFRHSHRREYGSILRIEFQSETPLHRGDFSLTTVGGGPFVDYMSEGARRYWLEEPKAMVELLIGGPVRVVEIVR